MNKFTLSHRIAALAIASAFIAAPSFAQGQGHGRGQDKQEEKAERKADKHADKAERKAEKRADKQYEKAEKRADKRQREEIKQGAYFNDDHRRYAREYYAQHYGDGRRCPPGLAKKNNGCMPPGQARKWNVGEPIPRGVVVYSGAPAGPGPPAAAALWLPLRAHRRGHRAGADAEQPDRRHHRGPARLSCNANA